MNSKENSNQKPEVLYQKLGNVWYAFSTAGEEVIFTALPEGVDPRDTELDLYEVVENKIEKSKAPRKSPEAAA